MEKNDYREKIIEMINEIDEPNVLRYVYIIILDIMEEKSINTRGKGASQHP